MGHLEFFYFFIPSPVLKPEQDLQISLSLDEVFDSNKLKLINYHGAK